MSDAKKSFRKHTLKHLQSLPLEEIQRKSDLITETLLGSPWWKQSGVVLLFFSIPGEVVTTGIIHAARAEGKLTAAPRVENTEMVFYKFRSLIEGFTVGKYGIREPDPKAVPLVTEYSLQELDTQRCLVVTPGVAFDRSKNRLGRGGGYYDRFLSLLREKRDYAATAVGVCFREQLFDSVPHSVSDQPVDCIITDAETIC